MPPQRWLWRACPLHQTVWTARCVWGRAGTHPNSASFQAEFHFVNVTQEIVSPRALLPLWRGRPGVCFFRGKLVIGKDCGRACRGKRLKEGEKTLHLASTSDLDVLQGRWWSFMSCTSFFSEPCKQQMSKLALLLFFTPPEAKTFHILFISKNSEGSWCLCKALLNQWSAQGFTDSCTLYFGWNALFLCSNHIIFTFLFLNFQSSHCPI